MLLVDDAVRVPASIGSEQGTIIAERNRALIGTSGISEAMARLLQRQIDEGHPRQLYVATVCVDTISLLLKRALSDHVL